MWRLLYTYVANKRIFYIWPASFYQKPGARFFFTRRITIITFIERITVRTRKKIKSGRSKMYCVMEKEELKLIVQTVLAYEKMCHNKELIWYSMHHTFWCCLFSLLSRHVHGKFPSWFNSLKKVFWYFL